MQSERTALAWQRAALSVTVGSLVILRVAATSLATSLEAALGGSLGLPGLPLPFAVGGLAVGVLGLVAAALIALRSRGRHPRLLRPGRGPGPGPVPAHEPQMSQVQVQLQMPGAALLALLCSVALVFGAAALVFVLSTGFG
ncbi:DUF202 domain-containing protein [Subtercola sp. Z020]|uniref:DUF202 domain-containing protein n=1 Tax=Subtercola sp. Z020 TaxID=2080582 RepID=UPI0018EDE87E|nr:DUF202 domain-containing protein [Subtercola sp. Z020]